MSQGLRYWFSYAYETKYSFGNVDAITSDYTACGSSFGVSHFLTLPNANAAKELGTISILEERIKRFSAVNSDQPVNAILVDFASKTSLLEVTQVRNKAFASRRAAQTDRMPLSTVYRSMHSVSYSDVDCNFGGCSMEQFGP